EGLLAMWVTIAAQSPVLAQAGSTDAGPALGSKVPPFKARDQFGHEQSLATLVGQNGLVLLFVRSADWCPFCKEQLVQLQKAQHHFRQKGLNLAAISYDTVEIFKAFSQRYDITYSLLADPNSEIIR